MTLPPIAASVPTARHFVDARLREHGEVFRAEDVRLVASELATNAVRHGRTPFSVMLEGTDHRIELTVSDDSVLRPVVRPVAALSTGGRGLAIVSQHSEAWGVHEGRRNAKSVWASFDTRL